MNIRTQYFETPFGELILGSFEERLCLCDWRYRKMRSAIDRRICEGLSAGYQEGKSLAIDEAIAQLTDYFRQKRTTFDLPLMLVGTEFQKRVWEELRQIPYGQTVSYLDLSLRLRNKLAVRAVAAANGANALSIIVPCHRVVGSKGELTGYAGGLAAKRKLLELEGNAGELNLFQKEWDN
jgi:methylated-DNA-[protein]-cysteine S-methyltransferase